MIFLLIALPIFLLIVIIACIRIVPLPLPCQALLFLALSALLWGFARPIAVKKLKIAWVTTKAESLAGGRGLVVKDIPQSKRGEVEIGGAIWHARSIDGEAILAGTECTIERIVGPTLYVRAGAKDTGGDL